jgi:transcription elongation GreA/GreB family factor
VAATLLASPDADEIVREMEARVGRGPAADRARDRLVATRDLIREAANLGAAVGAAEDAWRVATESLERRDLPAAESALDRASQLATEARERRIREIGEALSAVEDHIAAARKVGADVAGAEDLRVRARSAFSEREYVTAGDLIKQAERAAMQGQQRQIEQAIRLRENQIERARSIIASCEPLLQEAESYDLSVADVRTLLRQARDVLAKGDYLAGLTFARNAEEAAYRLSSQVEDERRRRGIERPARGVCGVCGSDHLTFYEDGWGTCTDCRSEFRWRGPLGLRERLRGLLGT